MPPRRRRRLQATGRRARAVVLRLRDPAARRTPNARDHALFFVGAFAVLVAAGTLLLAIPWTTEAGGRTGLPDALLTAMSAVSGTFAVVDTAAHWNPLGEAVILVLIQAGGLGFMVGASLILQVIRRSASPARLSDAVLLRDGSPALSLREAASLSGEIVRYTLTVEAIGALALAGWFAREVPLGTAIWHGIFLSISSFCNAGFDLTGSNASLAPYRGSVWVNVVVMLLIQVGALSYFVVGDLVRTRRWSRMAIDTRLILIVHAALVAGGAVAFLAGEWRGVLDGLAPGDKALVAAFHSVSARSAGFQTVDLGGARDGTLFLLSGLMFLGGAPGSTAGGIKLTVAGVIGVVVLATLRGQDEANLMGRRIPQAIIARALTVVVLMGLILFLATLAVSLTESAAGASPRFIDVLFETTSALGSVGLSTGLTPALSTPGKLVLVVTMAVGKIGPLTVAYALQRRMRPVPYRLPEANIRIG